MSELRFAASRIADIGEKLDEPTGAVRSTATAAANAALGEVWPFSEAKAETVPVAESAAAPAAAATAQRASAVPMRRISVGPCEGQR
jgi:hypothetical protein